MIKNKEDLKNIQIVCRNKQDIENCLNMLEELGFEVRNNDNQYKVIFYREYSDMFENDIRLECEKDTYFFNKKFIKILKKLIKEKQEKEKVEDFEVAEDGRITKINNRDSQQKIYTISGTETDLYHLSFFNKMIDLSLLYATAKARDKAMFKLEIETKLKNIAERLNSGRKINWEDRNQAKFSIYYNYDEKIFYCCLRYSDDWQGAVYCLDKNFLDVAKQEIGENDLIKYFKEDFN